MELSRRWSEFDAGDGSGRGLECARGQGFTQELARYATHRARIAERVAGQLLLRVHSSGTTEVAGSLIVLLNSLAETDLRGKIERAIAVTQLGSLCEKVRRGRRVRSHTDSLIEQAPCKER